MTLAIFSLKERRHQRLFLITSVVLFALAILFAFGWYQISSRFDQFETSVNSIAAFLRRISILPVGLICCGLSVPVFIRLAATQHNQWGKKILFQSAIAVCISFVLVSVFCFVTERPSVPAMQLFWMFIGNMTLILPPFLVVIIIVNILEFMNFAMQESMLAARLTNQLNTAKLESISARLQPHFLFNALQCISTLLHENADAADQAISRLSAVLRRSLSGPTDQLVSLKEETDAIDEYVSIYQLRFQSRLIFEKKLANDVLNAKIPLFCLQPIVENSIHYGLDKSGTGTCVVRLSARSNNGSLEIEISNNSTESSNQNSHNGHGLGLNLLRRQLEIHYNSQFELVSKYDQYSASVTLTIPLDKVAEE